MKNLTIIGVRLIALFVLIKALMSLEIFASYFLNEYSGFSDYWYYFLAIGIYLLIAAILFFCSERIATFIIPKSEIQDFQIDNYQKLSAILFSTIGLLIVYWSIQSLFQSVASIINMNVMYPDYPDVQKYRTLTIIFGGFIQLVIGILLFIGGKKLAKWWYDFRNWT